MKKLITLFLAIAGCVGTASATKLYVFLKAESSSWLTDSPRIMAHLWNDDSDAKDVEMTKEVKYGEIWYSCDLDGRTKALIARQDPSYGTSTSIDWDHVWNQTSDMTGLSTTEDTYGELWKSGDNFGVWTGTAKTPRTAWSGLCIRSSKDHGGESWDNYEANTTQDGDTFTKTYTKAEINSVVSAGGNFYFRFRHVDGVEYDETEACRNGVWTQIQVESDTELPFGTPTTGTHKQDYENGGYSWYFVVPSYDFEKVVLTAKYVNESGYKWKISADAYISKAITSAGYATFSSAAPVDFTNAIANLTDVSIVTGATGAKLNLTSVNGGTVPANTGLLIEGTAGTISIPVAASSSTDVSANKLQPAGESTYALAANGGYVLMDGDNGVGFYKNNNSFTVGAHTAYLLADFAGSAARAFFSFNDEASAISSVKQEKMVNGEVYNLKGQRVAQPQKGLYIVNGKKVIIK